MIKPYDFRNTIIIIPIKQKMLDTIFYLPFERKWKHREYSQTDV